MMTRLCTGKALWLARFFVGELDVSLLPSRGLITDERAGKTVLAGHRYLHADRDEKFFPYDECVAPCRDIQEKPSIFVGPGLSNDVLRVHNSVRNVLLVRDEKIISDENLR